jgi:hypothetical protein
LAFSEYLLHFHDSQNKIIGINLEKEKEARKKAEAEVERLSKYVEKLEIYSPENDWSQPEWRKLIGSKEEHEAPDTLFNLYQFRLAHTYEKRES